MKKLILKTILIIGFLSVSISDAHAMWQLTDAVNTLVTMFDGSSSGSGKQSQREADIDIDNKTGQKIRVAAIYLEYFPKKNKMGYKIFAHTLGPKRKMLGLRSKRRKEIPLFDYRKSFMKRRHRHKILIAVRVFPESKKISDSSRTDWASDLISWEKVETKYSGHILEYPVAGIPGSLLGLTKEDQAELIKRLYQELKSENKGFHTITFFKDEKGNIVAG